MLSHVYKSVSQWEDFHLNAALPLANRLTAAPDRFNIAVPWIEKSWWEWKPIALVLKKHKTTYYLMLNMSFSWFENGDAHDAVIKWKHFPRYWPFVRGIHRSPVNSPHKGQWRGALIFSLICVWINGWVSNREAGDLRRYRAHYDVIVMIWAASILILSAVHNEPVCQRDSTIHRRSIGIY